MTEGDAAVSRQSLTEKLQYLYRVAIPPERDGRPWTDRDLAVAIADLHAGEKVVSFAYLNQLRTGKQANPTRRIIDALAAVFKVPPAYFLDDGVANRIDAGRTQAADDAEVQILALRARALSPRGRAQVSAMIDYVAELERNAKGPGDG